MKAVGKYIVVKPLKEEKVKTSGGLILGEKHREDVRYKTAEVLVVGHEVNAVKKGKLKYHVLFHCICYVYPIKSC